MATGNSKRFVELGIAVPLAKEIAAQITASTGNARRLRELGIGAKAIDEYGARDAGSRIYRAPMRRALAGGRAVWNG